ncbi:MAG: SDR family oxidoreductase [Actinobacteria bacterium]|nr:SDR family oxidoreductase [Actinomycetota bacterium]
MGRFDGKTALVSGSTQGIGEAVARRFASEGAAGIVVCGRNKERGARVAHALVEMGTEALFVPVELGDAGSCEALVAATDDRFGRVDILVNAAGLSLRGSIIDTTVELWDTLMNVNVRAPFLLMQGVIKIMRREGIGGAIVNVASVAAYGSVPFLTPYATSKGALVTLTKNVAYSVAWDRIRVNCLSPGWMDTPGEDAIQRRFHTDGRDWLADAEARQPFGQLIKPDEVARAIAFLASDDAGIMTGAIVDYDQSIMGGGPQPVTRPEETP